MLHNKGAKQRSRIFLNNKTSLQKKKIPKYCVLFTIRFCYFSAGTEIGIFLEPLNLPSLELVFFAVNDNDSKHSAGGSHWYVLLDGKLKLRS